MYSTFMTVSRWFFRRMRKVSGKSCSEKKTYILSSTTFFSRKSCRLWENVGENKYGTAGQTTDVNIARRMRIACRITKATYTHSEYVITIPFPRQQWLRERSSLLRYTYRAVLNRTVMQLGGNRSNSAGQI